MILAKAVWLAENICSVSSRAERLPLKEVPVSRCRQSGEETGGFRLGATGSPNIKIIFLRGFKGDVYVYRKLKRILCA